MPTIPQRPPEARMKRALVAVLKRLGLIDVVVPSDDDLLTLAWEYSKKRPAFADCKGKLVTRKLTMKDVLAGARADLDDDIPF